MFARLRGGTFGILAEFAQQDAELDASNYRVIGRRRNIAITRGHEYILTSQMSGHKLIHPIVHLLKLNFSHKLGAVTETTWQPSLLYPNRLHAQAFPASHGTALCGAELEPVPVRCALCSLLANGYRTSSAVDIRAQLEAECVDGAEPTPGRLLVLSGSDLDADLAAQREAAQALEPVHRAIVDAFVETSRAVSALGAAQECTRAAHARAHLVETLVALDESLTSHDDAQVTLRRG